MDKHIRNNVRYASMTREMWTDLEERYIKESTTRVFELKLAIAMLRQEKSSVTAYFTKLKGLWDESQSIAPWPKCNCGNCTCDMQKKLSNMCEREKLYDFLIGLDEVFNTIKTQILSMPHDISLRQAYNLVAEDEQQRLISST